MAELPDHLTTALLYFVGTLAAAMPAALLVGVGFCGAPRGCPRQRTWRMSHPVTR